MEETAVRGGYADGYGGRRGSTRAEDAQGTPSQSHISPSLLEHTKRKRRLWREKVPFMEGELSIYAEGSAVQK